jgi:hypothetical protein
MERAAMRGRLEELRQKQARCRYSIRGTADAIRGKINTSLIPPDELEVPLIDELWDQLKSSWSELELVNADIKRLEKELV